MKNIWGIMVRRMYGEGKQYDNVEQLREAIREAWEDIGLEVPHTLIDSMLNRIFEGIKKNGASINY